MLALYHIFGRHCHVVAEIVETKLVVGTECDVAGISFTASLRIGLMLVDAVYCLTVEHVERTHPLRVTF